MEEVRLIVQEEGRAARNLIAFNVPLKMNQLEKNVTNKHCSTARISEGPGRPLKSAARVRSASTGRDKRSGKVIILF